MDKALLRKEKLAWRSALEPQKVAEYSRQITDNVLNFFDIQPAHKVHLFFSIEHKKEVQTLFLFEKILGIVPLQHCFTSFIDYSTNTLCHTQILQNCTWQTDRYGIPVPFPLMPVRNPRLDIIFVPLVVFNRKNHRIGYGKGYYDKFLSQYPASTTIGLAFEGQKGEFVADPHDIPLKYVVTEQCIYFRGRK
ncbi:MAG: 5-formyltetrahydrofolate cyclo-ligase [Bacteroidia bacterium]|nr:5-formyltetrahydrofolate cyclo-ligase [Bacteroidia bacterium]MDW8348147.1 5-formyltetrahydrofolate cyclo-ligase [Bacteroidia bacterium]